MPATLERETESPADAGLPVQSPSLPGQKPLIDPNVPRLDSAGNIIPRESLLEFLKSIDFESFLVDRRVPEVKQLVKQKFGNKRATKVSGKEFEAARLLAFDWWKCRRMFPEKIDPKLSEEQWEEIHRAHAKVVDLLRGKSIAECVRIMRTLIACSERVLMGLPMRFHVWRKGR